MDFNQVGLCYPSPADDPDNHRVKAQNLGVVWPTYRQQARGASSPLAEFRPAKSYAGKVPDTDHALQASRQTGIPH